MAGVMRTKNVKAAVAGKLGPTKIKAGPVKKVQTTEFGVGRKVKSIAKPKKTAKKKRR